MTETCDVAIVGAGIVGAACAYELSLAGLRTVVAEPNAIGSGATHLGYGSLSVQDDVPGQLALTRYGLALWDKLVEYLPRECEYFRCGTLWIANDDKQMQAMVIRDESFRQQGVRAQLLTAPQVALAEPGLGVTVAGGLLVPGDGCMLASRAAEYLLQLAAKKGVEHLSHRVAEFNSHELQLSDGSTLYAGSIVNAAGIDADFVSPELPVSYSKGHVLVVETREACAQHQISAIAFEQAADADGVTRFEVRQSVSGSNQSSELWIGSSAQVVKKQSATAQVEAKMVAHLLRQAIEMVPAIGSAKPLRSWTGLRVTSADGLPFIGRMPGKENVFAAAGHGAFGVTTALATGKLIADELLCQTSEIDATPYRANRFEGVRAKHAK